MIKIVHDNNYLTIDGDNFAYSCIEGMYKTGDGYGCQVYWESDRERIEKFCQQVHQLIRDFNDGK